MSEWISGQLGDITEIVMGQSPPGDSCNEIGDGIPLLNGPTEFTNNHPIPVQYTLDSKRESRIGDILFCVRGSTTGKMNWSDQVYSIGRGIAAIRHNSDITCNTFIKAAIENKLADLLSAATGSTFPNISRNDLISVSLEYPSLAEQRAIAEVLSSLDDKIDLLHRNNKTLEEMAEVLFENMMNAYDTVSVREVMIGDICERITKGTTPTTLGKPFVETGINFIKAESIDDTGSFIKSKFAYIDSETHDMLNRSQLQEGDVLFTIAGTIGRSAIVVESILPANTNQAVAILRVKNDMVSPVFLKYVMRSKLIHEIMEAKVVHAVQPNLSLGEISNTVINLPNQDDLSRFDNIVSPIQDKLKANSQQLETLISLRDQLLPKLMSGQVRVKDIAL